MVLLDAGWDQKAQSGYRGNQSLLGLALKRWDCQSTYSMLVAVTAVNSVPLDIFSITIPLMECGHGNALSIKTE